MMSATKTNGGSLGLANENMSADAAQSLLIEFERRYEIYWNLSLKAEEARFCHHTRMKNTYKAMATRDCIKELKKTFKL